MYLSKVSALYTYTSDGNIVYVHKLKQTHYENISTPFNLIYTHDYSYRCCDFTGRSRSIISKSKNSTILHHMFESKYADNIAKFIFSFSNNCLYKIPRTLTVAYYDTHLISAYSRYHMLCLFIALKDECVDVLRVIYNAFFLIIRDDFGAYLCANL
jgi:hypothetical protein